MVCVCYVFRIPSAFLVVRATNLVESLCIFQSIYSTGRVWSWGDGDFGKLGRGGVECSKLPRLISFTKDTNVIKVRCGNHFSVAMSNEGKVYTW